MNFIYAFIVGGLFCIPAQLLLDKTKLTNARILTGYVVAGVILYAFGIYEKIVEFASAGATIPLTGFGFSLAKGVRTAVDSQGLLGVFTGGLTSTSAGITCALCLGFVISIFCKSKQK